LNRFYYEGNWEIGGKPRMVEVGRSSVNCAVKLAFTASLAFLLMGAGPPDVSADRTKLLALENAWNLAQLHHDSRALNDLIPDSYVYTDYDGSVMNKSQFMADIRDPSFRPTLVTSEDVQVFPYDNAAVITGTYHTKGKYKGKPIDHWG